MFHKNEELDPPQQSSIHWLNTEQLPYVTSAVERFLPDLRGVADGMILTNGVEVCFAPHLSADILRSVQPGDRVTVCGTLVRALTVISAVVIETMDGARIVDDGVPQAGSPGNREAQSPPPHEFEVGALVRRTLHGPTGEIRGCLLDDATTVRFPPCAVGLPAGLLGPASWLVVRGEGSVTELGTVIEAAEIGPSRDSLRPVKLLPGSASKPQGLDSKQMRKSTHAGSSC